MTYLSVKLKLYSQIRLQPTSDHFAYPNEWFENTNQEKYLSVFSNIPLKKQDLVQVWH